MVWEISCFTTTGSAGLFYSNWGWIPPLSDVCIILINSDDTGWVLKSPHSWGVFFFCSPCPVSLNSATTRAGESIRNRNSWPAFIIFHLPRESWLLLSSQQSFSTYFVMALDFAAALTVFMQCFNSFARVLTSSASLCVLSMTQQKLHHESRKHVAEE